MKVTRYKQKLVLLFSTLTLLISSIPVPVSAMPTDTQEGTINEHSRAPASIFNSSLSITGPDGTYTGTLNASNFQVDIVKYDWTSIPRVTELHSWNAAVATVAEDDVYFIPTLDQFPTDITTLLQKMKFVYNTSTQQKTVNGFSAIYKDYFDDEVIYSADDDMTAYTANSVPDANNAEKVSGFTANTHITNKKKVYSSVMNSRALELLGYDLLLESEKYIFPGEPGNDTPVLRYDPLYNEQYAAMQDPTYKKMLSNSYQYKLAASNAGTGFIKTKTAVMDLYKALGQYYWDINFHFFRVDQPILEGQGTNSINQGGDYALRDYNYLQVLQQLTQPIATSIGPEGDHHGAENNYETPIVNTDAGITMVAATRTNPELYWDAAKKDMVFGGGARNAKSIFSYAGEADATTFTKSPDSYLTIGEFCELARAMMELYGEPIMTETEQLMMIQNYGMTLPTNLTQAQNQAVRYLAAKGILDPTGIDFSQNLKWNDMSELLIRIADPDSRLTFKEVTWNVDSVLFKNGYLTGNYGGVSDIDDMQEVIDVASAMYYDYFIESRDNLTNFVLKDTTAKGVKYSVVTDNINLLNVDSSDDNAVPFELGKEQESDVTTPTLTPTPATVSADTVRPEYYPVFINDGITEEGFYHFRIRKDAATHTGADTFEFDRDWERYKPADLDEHLNNEAVDGNGYIKIGYATIENSKTMVNGATGEEISTVSVDAIIPDWDTADSMGNFDDDEEITGHSFYFLQAGGGIYKAVPEVKNKGRDEVKQFDTASGMTSEDLTGKPTLSVGTTNNVYIGTTYQVTYSQIINIIESTMSDITINKIDTEYTIGSKDVKASDYVSIQHNNTAQLLAVTVKKKDTKLDSESSTLKLNVTYTHYNTEQQEEEVTQEVTFDLVVMDNSSQPLDPNKKYVYDQYHGEDLEDGQMFLMHYTLDGYEWPNGFIGGFVTDSGLPENDNFGKNTRETIIHKVETRSRNTPVSVNSVSSNENPSTEGDGSTTVYATDYTDEYDQDCVLGYKMGTTYVDQSREFAVNLQLENSKATPTAQGDTAANYFRQLSGTNTTAMMFSMTRSAWDNQEFGDYSLFGIGMADQLHELWERSQREDNSLDGDMDGQYHKGASTQPYRYENVSTTLLLQDVTNSRVHIVIPGINNYDVFKTNFSTNTKKAGSGTAIYYKPGSDSDDVLLDADILLNEGLIQKIDIENNTISFVGAHNANVFIKQAYPGGYIIVGNTYFPLEENEIGFLHVGNKYYINIKAVMGWAIKSKALVNNDGVLELVIPSAAQEAFDDSSFQEGTKYAIYTADGVATPATFWKGWSGNDCLLLTSGYPLSNYMIVMSPDITEYADTIFYYRLKPTLCGGTQFTTDGAQEDAEDRWRLLTGTDPPEYDKNYYQLNYRLLDRTASSYQNNVRIGFLTQDIRDLDGNQTSKASIGYGFYPQKVSSVTEAIEYACGPNAFPIPISYIGTVGEGGGYFNALMNQYAINSDLGDTQSYLDYGTVPVALLGNSVSNNTVAKLNVTQAKDTQSYWNIQYDTSYKDSTLLTKGFVLPQPIGAFLPTHKVNYTAYKNVKNNTDPVYVGTMLATKQGSSVLLGNLSLGNSDDVDLAPALVYGNSNKTIYAYPLGAAKTKEAEDGEGNDLIEMISQANALVDWDAYKFKRLVATYDQISSIILIFVLNIFPRIGMWCFMILLALTALRGNKIIERIIEKTVDPIKLLSFGHQTYQTIELKRMVIQSMLALSIFMMIMDGHLMNFIIWAVKFGAVFMQR